MRIPLRAACRLAVTKALPQNRGGLRSCPRTRRRPLTPASKAYSARTGPSSCDWRPPPIFREAYLLPAPESAGAAKGPAVLRAPADELAGAKPSTLRNIRNDGGAPAHPGAARETRTREHQMTSNARPGPRILGSLRSADGKGVVRMEDRFDADIENLWSALTDPGRLARWMGEVEGDLRLGGEFRARFFASGWEGTGRVEACEPPRRLLLLTMQPGQSREQFIEVTLAADGAQATVIWEERGMPPGQLAAYGAGIQVHVEDLAAYLAGRERCDADARWNELLPAYEDLAANVG